MKKSAFIIEIDEPWDYCNQYGNNIIEGGIVRIVSDKSVVFRSNEPMVFKNHIGQIFLLKNRYQGDVLNLKDNKGDSNIVGGGLYVGDNYEEGDYDTLERDSIYVFIGTLRRI